MSATPLYFEIAIPVHAVFGYKDKVYFSGGGNGVKNQIVRLFIHQKKLKPFHLHLHIMFFLLIDLLQAWDASQ